MALGWNNLTRLVLTVFVAALLCQGCGATKVSDITQNVDNFKDRHVSLRGKVVETLALPFVHRGAYQLDDGTGKLWIIPAGDVPERGKQLRVTGTVRSGFEIAGRRLGLVLLEKEETE